MPEVAAESHLARVSLGSVLDPPAQAQPVLAVAGAFPVYEAQHGGAHAVEVAGARDQIRAAARRGTCRDGRAGARAKDQSGDEDRAQTGHVRGIGSRSGGVKWSPSIARGSRA
jgi:hypothetical protein